MSYTKALEAAGATVHAFEEFGSYQGDWFAKVTFEGAEGYVAGSFGSCSVCDAFQSEFDFVTEVPQTFEEWAEHWSHDEPVADTPANREAWAAKLAEYRKKLSDFGSGYLTSSLLTQEEAEAKAKENIEWDSEAPLMLAWLVAQRTAAR